MEEEVSVRPPDDPEGPEGQPEVSTVPQQENTPVENTPDGATPVEERAKSPIKSPKTSPKSPSPAKSPRNTQK